MTELPATSAAGTVAFSSVALTNVVVSAAPFHAMTEVATKLEPVTSKAVFPDPTSTLVGLIATIAGVGLFTEKLSGGDVPPPGAAFWTVTCTIELPPKSAAGTLAFSSVTLTNVVASAAPFHAMIDVATKLEPITSRAVLPEPASTLVGLMLVTVGVGLFTVKLVGDEVPPPGAGLMTAKFATIALDKSLAGIFALSDVADPKLVAIGIPFHSTVEAEMNPDPVTVMVVSAEPTTVEEGLTLAMLGLGFGLGGGLLDALGPPAQPPIEQTRDTTRTNETETGLARFMGEVLYSKS